MVPAKGIFGNPVTRLRLRSTTSSRSFNIVADPAKYLKPVAEDTAIAPSAWARACGADGVTITKSEDLAGALTIALHLLDERVDRVEPLLAAQALEQCLARLYSVRIDARRDHQRLRPINIFARLVVDAHLVSIGKALGR